MIKIDGNKITMTRGDTLRVDVGIVKDGEDYTPQVGDAVRFAMRKQKMNADRSEFLDEVLITKDIPIATMKLELEPEDTQAFGFGLYVYDIEITFEDGTVATFIANEDFILAPEVE